MNWYNFWKIVAFLWVIFLVLLRAFVFPAAGFIILFKVSPWQAFLYVCGVHVIFTSILDTFYSYEKDWLGNLVEKCFDLSEEIGRIKERNG